MVLFGICSVIVMTVGHDEQQLISFISACNAALVEINEINYRNLEEDEHDINRYDCRYLVFGLNCQSCYVM